MATTMASDDRIFRLFACNIPVAGACRSILCDLQRSEYYQIPMAVYTLLTEHAGRTVGEIKAELSAEDGDRVDALFADLIESELGFWLEGEAASFPPLDLSYDEPAPLGNAIIDADAGSRHDYPALFAQLDGLGCGHLELRFYAPIGADALDALLAPTLRGRLRSIQLVIPFAGWDDAGFARLCDTHARIATISVHGAPRRETRRPGKSWVVHFFPERIESADACGKIHPGYFQPQPRHLQRGPALQQLPQPQGRHRRRRQHQELPVLRPVPRRRRHHAAGRRGPARGLPAPVEHPPRPGRGCPRLRVPLHLHRLPRLRQRAGQSAVEAGQVRLRPVQRTVALLTLPAAAALRTPSCPAA